MNLKAFKKALFDEVVTLLPLYGVNCLLIQSILIGLFLCQSTQGVYINSKTSFSQEKGH